MGVSEPLAKIHLIGFEYTTEAAFEITPMVGIVAHKSGLE